MVDAGSLGIGSANPVTDVALSHLSTFVLMFVLMLIFGIRTVAKESKASIKKLSSFRHLWMAAYIVTLLFLMTLTTGMALVILFDDTNHLRFNIIPASIAPMAAAVAGVFGFEVLFRKLIVGFGDIKLDVASVLQDLVDQAVAATLKKEVG